MPGVDHTPFNETSLNTMSTASLPFRMPKPVSRKVRLLRWLVRSYVLLDGLAAVLLVAGVAFWIGLGLDWTFEPSPTARVLMWALTAVAAVVVGTRYLFGPLSVRLSNTNLALLLERNFPDLKQSVITTVEAADGKRATPHGDDRLLANTSQEAAQRLGGARLLDIFKFRPLLWKTGVAAALTLSIVAFSSMQSEAFAFWLQRLQLTEQPWPRRVALSVIGFSEIDGMNQVNVARDDDYELQVMASIRDDHEAPERVEIRYRLADGRRGRDTMTRIGKAVPGRDDGQLFRYQFKKVAADLKFDLVGGDDRLRGLQLHVVERPQIVRMLLQCEFSNYLQRTPQTIPVSGRVELPEGTQAICRLESNKPLRSVRVHDPASQQDLKATIEASNDREFNLSIQVNQDDRVLLVTMLDADGVENREPYRVVISPVLDQPPEVSVQLRGIGSAITPQAKIPFVGSVTDEYGLTTAWYEYQIDKSAPEQRPLQTQPNGRLELRDLGEFDLAITDSATNRQLVELKPGQQLSLSLKSNDAYDLNGESHTGSSQRIMLDVVTASELRSLLEKKELALRQRFESIFEKMTGTRELLDRMKSASSESDADGADTAGAERLRERDRLRVSGSLQNVVQLSYETLGVADSIEDIVGELVNNRVDSEELTQRLLEGIAQPLREIGGELMPQLEVRLQELQSAIAAQDALEQPLTAAKLQGDEVLDAMQSVLDRMLELESYNELVELLRGIVAEQQQLQEETKQQRRAKLRSLLED